MYPRFPHLTLSFVVLSCLSVQGVFAANADDFLSGLEKIINASTPVSQTGSTQTGTTIPTQPGTSTGAVVNEPTKPVEPTPTKPDIPVPTTTTTTTTTPPVIKRENLANTNASGTGSKTGTNGLSLNSASNAPVCNLPEVQSVLVREHADKSTLRWASVVGAAGYDILKKTASGDFVLVERVKDPAYTIYLAAGNIKYDQFKIAAVCPESGTSSPRTSAVTRVKTGPELIILGILASLLTGGVVFLKRKKLS